MNDAWHVYLLLCTDGAYYCGITKDVERRLRQHNGEIAGGARFTAGRRPLRLMASRAFPDMSSALRFEADVKKLPKWRKPGAFAEF